MSNISRISKGMHIFFVSKIVRHPKKVMIIKYLTSFLFIDCADAFDTES